MKNLKYISLLLVVLSLVACKSDEAFFGEEVYNEFGVYPYVAIQDRNENLDNLPGANNYWSFELTPEANGSQVRIEYSTQDENIVSHEITVTIDFTPTTMNCAAVAFISPTNTKSLRTINTFPTDEIITKEQVATALGVTVESLSGKTVYFGGKSLDADGNSVDEVSLFETYLKCERHAYFYLWDIE